MATCGQSGGTTKQGTACKRAVPWGTPLPTGPEFGPDPLAPERCRDHPYELPPPEPEPPAEPQPQTIEAPEGWAFDVVLADAAGHSQLVLNARSVSITPFRLAEPEPPEPAPEPDLGVSLMSAWSTAGV